MFETLDSAPEQKAVKASLTRLFFGTYILVSASGIFFDLHTYRLNRPVPLGIDVLMFAASALWLRDSWTGLSSKKFSMRLIFLVFLLLLSGWIH
jgi:hypothetical protein